MATVDGVRSAVTDTSLAIVLIDLVTLEIVAASAPALAHVGLAAEAVIGRPAADFVVLEERTKAVEALRALQRGAIDVYIVRRQLHAPAGADPMTAEWMRRFRLGDQDVALLHLARPNSVGTFDRHLASGATRMAIGTADSDCAVTALSTDIRELLGLEPADFLGKRVIDQVARRDTALLLHASDESTRHAVGVPIHLRNRDGDWVPLCCVLTTLQGDVGRCFLLMPEPETLGATARVADLERQLWRIASIVESTGVVHRIAPPRDLSSIPQVNDLSTRQWEVLARIVQGERVPAIAADLHLSPSTIRNHLAAIYRRFGVHSQSELIRTLTTQGSSR